MTPTIFLSYASQDADAAHRICDALRAAGLVVWFDQSELRGGDAWDASIRKQIKECTLFVPIVSENTQQRPEGYFRLEWKLAVDRSHLMADTHAFFFPVVLGSVSESAALVPDKFRERQWSRLNDDSATKAFAAQIAKLASGSASPSKNTPGTAPTAAIAQEAVATADYTPSIAVLAFANRSTSADDEYFSDGLADELLNVLAKIKGLRVAARTSAFSFKGKQTTVAEIGRILNVATILEGSVRKSGNRVRISVQLVKVNDGFHLWSGTYDRTLEDIFIVQDDIAQSVVTELRTTLMGERLEQAEKLAAEIAQVTAKRSDSPEAQRLLLQARFYCEKRRPADIKRALVLAEEAVDVDPHYADAHTCLARTLQQMAVYGAAFSAGAATRIGYAARARASAEAALALDATLAAPHVVLSWIACVFHRDRVAGLREAKMAIALAPNDAEAIRTLGHRLMEDGQFAEAETLFSRAIQIDPLFIMPRNNFAMLAQWRGQPQEALRRVRETLSIDESAWIAYWNLSRSLSALGDYAGAVEAFAHSRALLGEQETAGYLRQQFAAGGWEGYLAALISAPINIARIHIAGAQLELGLIDDAFATLDAMVDQYEQQAVFLKHWPEFASLRSDPRYVELLKRAGFTQ